MTRTTAREIAIQLIFGLALHPEDELPMLEHFFDREYFATLAKEDPLFAEYPNKKQLRYILTLCGGVIEKRAELDAHIEKYARGWKLSRISRTALAVLRCCLYELLYMPEVPAAAAINEAVELAKGYEAPETVSFINGILGSFMRGEKGGMPSLEDVPPQDADADSEVVADAPAVSPAEPSPSHPDGAAADC